MRAIRYQAHGGPEQLRLEEAPLPTLCPDEVLVRQAFSSVNPADWKLRAGWFNEWVPQIFPFIPGADITGTVVAAGPLAAGFAPGMRVAGMVPVQQGGAWAELVPVKAPALTRLSDTVSMQEAAGLPLAGLTAWTALFDLGLLRPGQKVLIHAAAGGVGSLAVQLAKIAGAYVIATCSADNKEMVAALGADKIIDYRVGDFADGLGEVDLVLDTIGGTVRQRSIAVLRPGGTLVTLDPTPPEPTLTQQVRVATVAVAPDGGRLLHLVHLLATGRLRVPIDRVFAMEEAACAHIHSQDGHARGKILISIDATMDRTIF
ncbi:NADP-dependent oxidoreductase [Niveispirillum sp.]|uniref:NADP-dependent oxidoreductase n=1 Tax=Niveispirillum sp. TaxID=1917217 RepID=UPI001B5889C4|nr:NADP-dependent oxidoreductase [Niveispirillum sp.]MBP7335688.1 NADP-dependent oxidoreductase [Niveispirillum sp.]